MEKQRDLWDPNAADQFNATHWSSRVSLATLGVAMGRMSELNVTVHDHHEISRFPDPLNMMLVRMCEH